MLVRLICIKSALGTCKFSLKFLNLEITKIQLNAAKNINANDRMMISPYAVASCFSYHTKNLLLYLTKVSSKSIIVKSKCIIVIVRELKITEAMASLLSFFFFILFKLDYNGGITIIIYFLRSTHWKH